MKEFLATVHAAHWDTSSSQSHLCKSTSVLLKNKNKYDAKCMCDFFKPAKTDVFRLRFVFLTICDVFYSGKSITLIFPLKFCK